MMRFLSLLFVALITVQILGQKRVVSLAPSITYTIQQMGAENTIVGRTSYCPEIEGATVVGDVLSTNLESIVALRPDVVFTMAFTKPNIISRLKSLGIEVVDFPTPSSFDEIVITTLHIGSAIEEQGKTQDYLSRELDNVKAIRDSIASKNFLLKSVKFTKALFQIGTNPLWAVTPDSYMSEYISAFRIDNIVSSNNGQISREHVLTQRPDVIFISDMGDTGLASTEASEWKRLIPHCKTVIVDANKSCCPTPQFFRETLQTIYEALSE